MLKSVLGMLWTFTSLNELVCWAQKETFLCIASCAQIFSFFSLQASLLHLEKFQWRWYCTGTGCPNAQTSFPVKAFSGLWKWRNRCSLSLWPHYNKKILVFYFFFDRNSILHCYFMLISFKSRNNWVDSTKIKTDCIKTVYSRFKSVNCPVV